MYGYIHVFECSDCKKNSYQCNCGITWDGTPTGWDQFLVESGISLKKVNMIRKYHNHKIQTNPRHCEEELQDIYSNKASKRQ